MEFVSVSIVYPGIFGLSGMFYRYLSSLFLKLVTDIYWKATEKLWIPNLKAPFSDCHTFYQMYTVLFGGLGTGDPALLVCMILFQHLGQFLLEFSRCI